MAEWLESGKGPLKRSRSETSLATFRNTVPAPAELPKDDIALTRPTCQPFKMVDAARDSKRSNGIVGERREQFFAASGGSSPSLVPHPHRHYRVCSPTHRTVFALKKEGLVSEEKREIAKERLLNTNQNLKGSCSSLDALRLDPKLDVSMEVSSPQDSSSHQRSRSKSLQPSTFSAIPKVSHILSSGSRKRPPELNLTLMDVNVDSSHKPPSKAPKFHSSPLHMSSPCTSPHCISPLQKSFSATTRYHHQSTDFSHGSSHEESMASHSQFSDSDDADSDEGLMGSMSPTHPAGTHLSPSSLGHFDPMTGRRSVPKALKFYHEEGVRRRSSSDSTLAEVNGLFQDGLPPPSSPLSSPNGLTFRTFPPLPVIKPQPFHSSYPMVTGENGFMLPRQPDASQESISQKSQTQSNFDGDGLSLKLARNKKSLRPDSKVGSLGPVRSSTSSPLVNSAFSMTNTSKEQDMEVGGDDFSGGTPYMFGIPRLSIPSSSFAQEAYNQDSLGFTPPTEPEEPL